MTKISKAFYDKLIEQKEFKKSVIKYADSTSFLPLPVREINHKAIKYLYENDTDKGILKRSIVLNTYNWLDSHGDVHFDSTFTKSISERGKKTHHLHDHLFQVDAKVGTPIKFYEKSMSWKELGVDIDGETIALIMDSEIKKAYNETVYNAYLDDEVDQHSVAMRYIKIDLAINDEEGYPKEYKVWKDNIARIGNREKAEEQGFFFGVSEGALIEGSAVLAGSNELTPTLGRQPSKDTEDKAEPDKSTHLLEAINKVLQTI